jgi:predicted secreted protein
MMTSNAWWAYGSLFKVGNDGTAEVFATVAEVLDISGPTMTRETIDVSSHDSAGGYREFIAGWRDGGEVSVTANWIPVSATQDDTTGILSKFLDDDLHNYQILVPDGSEGSGKTLIELSGIVTNFGVSLNLNEQAKVDFTIKISGEVEIGSS